MPEHTEAALPAYTPCAHPTCSWHSGGMAKGADGPRCIGGPRLCLITYLAKTTDRNGWQERYAALVAARQSKHARPSESGRDEYDRCVACLYSAGHAIDCPAAQAEPSSDEETP